SPAGHHGVIAVHPRVNELAALAIAGQSPGGKSPAAPGGYWLVVSRTRRQEASRENIEIQTLNQRVEGSTPSRPTNKIGEFRGIGTPRKCFGLTVCGSFARSRWRIASLG